MSDTKTSPSMPTSTSPSMPRITANAVNINAVDLYNSLKNINEKCSTIDELLARIVECCSWSAGSYRSDDSNLASAYDNLADTFSKVIQIFNMHIAKMGDAFRVYIEDTVANEETKETEIRNLSSDISAISSELDSRLG